MAGRGHAPRDERRRALGQNFLTWSSITEEALARAEVGTDDHVVDLGAGTGALTLPLARTGAQVTAVEVDAVLAQRLRSRLRDARLDERVQVVTCDLRRFRLPAPPYRVVSNPPWGRTTEVLGLLLDDPDRGPERADLLVQREVALKRAAAPPTTLRSAAWAPWWQVEVGPMVPRRAFRPVPRADAAWLVVRRRDPPVLPTWLAAHLPDALRAAWQPPQPDSRTGT